MVSSPGFAQDFFLALLNKRPFGTILRCVILVSYANPTSIKAAPLCLHRQVQSMSRESCWQQSPVLFAVARSFGAQEPEN